jgi:ATP-dependent RNA helicase DDX49/DBP8
MPSNPLKRKLRALTTDDLLRRQEGGKAKRVRLSDSEESDDELSGSESVSELEESEKVDEDTGSEEGEDEEEEEDNDDDEEDAHVNATIVEDRIRSNRMEQTSRIVKLTPPKPMATAFSELGISPPLEAALRSMSIQVPTEVQAACIPPLLDGTSCHFAADCCFG